MDNIKSIFLLGIGGIGMSALAKYFVHIGVKVSGYDKTKTQLTQDLEELGCQISYEDVISAEMKYDLVVYTPAIPKDSILFNYFNDKEYNIVKRSKMLGMITKDKYTIAIAGSHGKTTVSSMITFLLRESGIDCTAFLGGISSNYNSNFIYGESNVMVVEADEYDRSFLTLYPDIIVITSIDTDHLEIYGDKSNIVKSFQEFVNLLKPNGKLILNDSLKNDINTTNHTTTYSLNSGDYYATNIELLPFNNKYTLNKNNLKYSLAYNGLHNIENSISALIVAEFMGIDISYLTDTFIGFKGVKRRFELLYQDNNHLLIDDYAHHPTEVKAILSSIKALYPNSKILTVFQPHLFSRTKDFYAEFASSLDIADEVMVLDIYPARELPIDGVTSELIVSKIRHKATLVSKSGCLDLIKKSDFHILLTIGAGDINNLHSEIIHIINDNK